MTELIYNERGELLSWACVRIGIASFRADAHAIGLRRSGRIVAVVVYDTFSRHECAMHIASDGSRHWLTRSFLKAAFAYPFIQCGYRRVYSPIAESNKKALRFNLKLGFKVEGVHPYAAKDGAMVTTGMLREGCAWIPKEYQHMRTS